ncbi:MAG TPA: type II toxin-antitoxin system Phd/YefM family antitoxin [Rubrobacter sp.]|nr:type II toxin-antitoxin system Phd/YefM family antitoxin [Rubrobacter sp.]
MGARYVVDENGERVSVILPIEEYERLIEELEELDDVKAAEEARREIETGADELIPWEQAKREMEEERARSKRDEVV